METFLAKIAVGFVFTSLLCVLFTLTTLSVLYAKIGLVGWSAPLQMVDAMQLAPYQCIAFRAAANAISVPPGEYGRKVETQRN